MEVTLNSLSVTLESVLGGRELWVGMEKENSGGGVEAGTGNRGVITGDKGAITEGSKVLRSWGGVMVLGGFVFLSTKIRAFFTMSFMIEVMAKE